MPPKPLEESTGLENYMLYKAAKLLAAVRWVAENPPMPEKEDYLNKMVLEEIAFIASRYALYMDPESRKYKIPHIHPIIQIVTDEWKAASHEQRKPRWDIFTEETIAYVCDQVATENPTWYPHFIPAGRGGDIPFPNRLELRKVLHREVPCWAAATPTVAALQEPDNPSAPAAEVDALPLSAPSPVGLLTQAAKKGKARIVEEPVKKMQARPVKAPAPAPAPSTPPVAGPSKKHKAPRRESSSEVSDSNDDETPTKKATEMPIFEAMQGAGRALDEDTCRQLNRIEAMLNAICNSNGILPESLPGYEHPSLASLSSHSPSLAGVQMEMLHISDTHSNTSAHSSSMLKLLHKKAGSCRILTIYTCIIESIQCLIRVSSQGKGKQRLHQRSHQWPDKLEKLTWIIVGQGVKRTIY
ncbi:hypothetical protein V8E53_013222 [Lactarius tabidus]